MQQVEIYTTPICGYCARAKALLDSKSISYTEINVMLNPDKRVEMEARSHGGRTVPQIFIGDVHVGGSDDLYALDRAGKLDNLLVAS